MLPPALSALDLLAHNLWWSWDSEATNLWNDIDPWRWPPCRHNPVALIREVEAERWEELARDPAFLKRTEEVVRRFQHYLSTTGWCQTHAPDVAAGRIAYFSMEFGLHESVRIYSGGLGVLAGDHLRSASDLAVPLTAVGFLYTEGYFRQVIDDGEQVAAYPQADFRRLPVRPALDGDGKQIEVSVRIGQGHAIAKIWQLDVGRNRLLLLDTDHEGNSLQYRALTHQLYGGDSLTRISQEVLLGVGGVRALRAIGENPTIFHLNEGHCAFIALELIRELRAKGRSKSEALSEVNERCVFTTHTPVPAGHDRFNWGEVEKILGPWAAEQGMNAAEYMDLGRVRPGDPNETLCMTVLALRASAKANGVSALHGEVSREMWQSLWPDREAKDVPIGHVTNGVHPTFWAAPESRAVWDQYLPAWRKEVWKAESWAKVDDIPDEVLWTLKNTLRAQLVNLVHTRSGTQLDPNALTIGFARRFAPYKRGDLLFSDVERIRALLDQGVQVVYSGKAHPQDRAGRQIIAEVLRWTGHRDFRNRVAFIEDYDMAVGRALTCGADVWLNNPRRPQEASGTSGQKVPLNAGINLSVLDGWWPEAYDGTNGWAIGGTQSLPNVEAQDAADAESLYRLLEQEVVPEWKARDARGLPVAWIKRMRRSIQTCGPAFTSHRMLRDYVLNMYAPLMRDVAKKGR